MEDDGELLELEHRVAAVRALVPQALAGDGQLAVIEGTAGLGKTRLLAAARAEAERAGMRVLHARCLELEREFAYGVVRQVFEPAFVHTSEPERAALLAGAAGQAAGLLGLDDAGLQGVMSPSRPCTGSSG